MFNTAKLSREPRSQQVLLLLRATVALDRGKKALKRHLQRTDDAKHDIRGGFRVPSTKRITSLPDPTFAASSLVTSTSEMIAPPAFKGRGGHN